MSLAERIAVAALVVSTVLAVLGLFSLRNWLKKWLLFLWPDYWKAHRSSNSLVQPTNSEDVELGQRDRNKAEELHSGPADATVQQEIINGVEPLRRNYQRLLEDN